MDNTNSTLTERTSERYPGVVHYKCSTCLRTGHSEHSKGLIKHSASCTTKEQPVSAVAAITVEHSDEILRTFAANVRRTGLTNGQDGLVAEAVRKGFLSDSDAMNTDD